MSNSSQKDKDLNSLLEEFKLELLDYVNKRLRLFKLDAFEKIGISMSVLGYSLMIFSLVAVILFFTLIGLAFFVSELLNNQGAGFGVMALFSILLLLIVVSCRKKIQRFILSSTITFIRKVDANEE